MGIKNKLKEYFDLQDSYQKVKKEFEKSIKDKEDIIKDILTSLYDQNGDKYIIETFDKYILEVVYIDEDFSRFNKHGYDPYQGLEMFLDFKKVILFNCECLYRIIKKL